MEHEIEDLNERLHYLQVELYGTQQAMRKEDVEISGIPSNISDAKLEGTVIAILNKLVRVPIHRMEVDSCHRISGPGKETIIRFKGRKRSEEVKDNSKLVNGMDLSEFGFPTTVKLYINDNLSTYYKSIHNKCKVLRSRHKISKLLVKDGQIKIKLPSETYFRAVYHASVLQDLFPDYNYDNWIHVEM